MLWRCRRSANGAAAWKHRRFLRRAFSFGAFTEELHALADWLAQCRIKSVVMESTGVYWIPVFGVMVKMADFLGVV
jgi:hypothetical protein